MLSLLAIAIGPCLAIMVYVYCKDKYEREPFKLVLYSFLGGVASIAIAAYLEVTAENNGIGVGDSLEQVAILAFLVVGVSEELSKYLFIRIIPYRNKAFNEPFDGIVYSVMVSMGFAMAENIMYVMQHGMATGIMRMFTAVPAHATFAIIMGYYIGKAKFSAENKMQNHLIGIGGAVFFHGFYDFSLMQNDFESLRLLGAVLSLIIAIRLSKKAMRSHNAISPFKP